MNEKNIKLTVKDISLIAMMAAVMQVCKTALSFVPNVELVTFWIIIFSLYLGKRIFLAIPVFILIEGMLYGFGLWWIMYLYMWPLLAIITLFLRKVNSAFVWSVISGIYGLLFGLFCSIPYIFIGAAGADFSNGLRTAFAWWISGIPWDLVHGVSNFFIMLVLYTPVTRVMKRIEKIF